MTASVSWSTDAVASSTQMMRRDTSRARHTHNNCRWPADKLSPFSEIDVSRFVSRPNIFSVVCKASSECSAHGSRLKRSVPAEQVRLLRH